MADLVTTTINYGVPPADGARAFFTINANASSGERGKNYMHEAHETQVENLRGKEDTVSLDTAGFQFYNIPAKYKGEFLDDKEIKGEYYPESEELLKKLTGASKVVIFDHSEYIHSHSAPYAQCNHQPFAVTDLVRLTPAPTSDNQSSRPMSTKLLRLLLPAFTVTFRLTKRQRSWNAASR